MKFTSAIAFIGFACVANTQVPVVKGPVQPAQPVNSVPPAQADVQAPVAVQNVQSAAFAPIGTGAQPVLAFHPGNQPPQQFPPFFPNNNNNRNFLACGFSCSRKHTLLTNIDGVFSSATCSDRNVDVRIRCNACCGAYALANGLQTTSASGFPSNNNQDCVCCINNNRC